MFEWGERDYLAARENGGKECASGGESENEGGVGRRLFDNFEKSVLGGDGEGVCLFDPDQSGAGRGGGES